MNPNTGRNRRSFLRLAARAGTTLGFAALVSSQANAAGRHSDPDYCPPGATPLCLLRGARVETERGPLRVEEIRIGDLIRTASGALEPVKWIGRSTWRRRDGQRWRGEVDPVRIARGALADNVPARDLYLSPAHALLVDGALIPVSLLVNGKSIAQGVFEGDRIDYFQIECASHQVMLAEGAPVETLRNTIGYESFVNFAERIRLYGEADTGVMAPYAPVLGYWNGKAHAEALLRSAASLVVDVRDPIQRAYDRFARRAKALA